MTAEQKREIIPLTDDRILAMASQRLLANNNKNTPGASPCYFPFVFEQ
jgi:hypothetical protein